MAKSLQMTFRNEVGKEVSLNLVDPLDDLTLEKVQPVMQDIVAKGIFASTGGNLVQVVNAKIRVNESTVLS